MIRFEDTTDEDFDPKYFMKNTTRSETFDKVQRTLNSLKMCETYESNRIKRAQDYASLAGQVVGYEY